MTARKTSAAGKSAPKQPIAKPSKKTATKSTAKKSATPHNTKQKAVAKKAPQSLPYEQGKWAAAYTRGKGEVRHWLVKSELDVFSFDDLLAAPGKTTRWDGVRNTGARNFLRDGMKKGDLVFYYHSNADPSAIAGIAEVVREGYPDLTAFDPKDHYYDAASNDDAPMWFCVDLKAVKKLARPVTLPELKGASNLQEMALLRVSRLSVVPVTAEEWKIVLAMSERSSS